MPRSKLPPSPALRLSALSAAIFAGIGIYMPFFPVWLESRDISPAAIGIIVALPLVVRIIATTPLVALTEKGVEARRLLMLAQLALALLYMILLGLEGALAIGFVVILVALAQAPLAPTSELLTTDAVRADARLDYGRIRLWGSLAFLASNIGAGYLLERAPADAAIIALVGIALIAAAVSRAAPQRVSETPAVDAEGRRPGLPAGLIWLIIGGALIQAAHATLYGFGSIAWRAQGISEALIGWLWAIGVIAEIILFWLIGRGVGRGGATRTLMLLGAGAAVVRFIGLALAPGLGLTIALQVLHGLTFGATHLGMMSALTRHAPAGARGKAQGLFAAAMALTTATGMVVSGLAYPDLGTATYLLMIPPALIGGAFVLRGAALLRVNDDQPQSARSGG
ncbi:MAG: MFS transporter, PPP family, 3-phenylpropionic acid transporter [Saliniramus fredricksonii]|uniref:MFS transporter, PPP family, 3-phenylpropionic acid transporter n=1 Tax=Saliniramus fredricksonii TaxID=1653334 RepID=A0A0P7YA75_9HYPH|nr:MFS transporter [Saliniramus fredricksonii]KPQ10969.1 MAG: MFS transporter, PPP family, 3-phenylpropionic acid transporter [Saliniramus fredricksonii]SCC81888.1 MFS transporter, PPP family, 3-phenylpropionic acid transporter [Saliniramus fredricksonii]